MYTIKSFTYNNSLPLFWYTPPFASSVAHPCQDRQCHIVVDGDVWLGKFAVWRFPVMQASDVQSLVPVRPVGLDMFIF